MIRGRVLDDLIFEEGRVVDRNGMHHAYQDHLGVWTIGYGTNLQELKIDEGQALEWLGDYLENFRDELVGAWPPFLDLDAVRQDALLTMAYQMGVPNLMKFPRMLAAIEAGDWETAAREGLDSKWARETSPARAGRVMERIRTGNWQR